MMDICGYEYHPDGVCAYQIRFDLIDGVVRNAEIRGGCDGGHQGLSHMVEGRTPEEIIGICKKVGCHDGNSCQNSWRWRWMSASGKLLPISRRRPASDGKALRI